MWVAKSLLSQAFLKMCQLPIYFCSFPFSFLLCRFLPYLIPASEEDGESGPDLSTLRTFRVLRPLKLVSGVPSKHYFGLGPIHTDTQTRDLYITIKISLKWWLSFWSFCQAVQLAFPRRGKLCQRQRIYFSKSRQKAEKWPNWWSSSTWFC